MNEETEAPRKELIRALMEFRNHVRKSAWGFLGYAIVSTGAGLCFLYSKDALMFGAGAPFILTGLFLLWPSVRLFKLANSANAILKVGEMSAATVLDHQNRVLSEIALLLHLRTVATFVLAIGILLLIPACIFHWSDSISSLSVALAIQGGLMGVAVMMTNFWLEIYLNEIQRHLR